jgi:DsbC/DsbD-like thiol-disulfide interchange protein
VTALAGEGALPVVTVHAPPVTLAAGGKGEARLSVTVADGYRVQANPASGEFFIPVELGLKAAGGVSSGEPVYPPGKPYRLPGTSDDLMTYEGTFEIVVPLRADASARPGSRRLKGALSYQACDSRSCLFPASLPFDLQVMVVAARGRSGAKR